MIMLRILVLLLPLASAVVINCEFKQSGDWSAVGRIYCCFLAGGPQIVSPNAKVTDNTGRHNAYVTNSEVRGFYSGDSSEIIEYMPQGLDDVFKSLIAIFINYGRIKEIHQGDMQNYTKLQFLDIGNNDIAFLEEDLFKHNVGLKAIHLHSNKIAEMHPTVFNHLTQLAWLNLRSDPCIDKFAKDNRQEVLELIEEAKGKCVPGPLLKANQEKQEIEEAKKIIARLREKYPSEMEELMGINETPGESRLFQFVAPGLLLLIALPLLCVIIFIRIDFGRLLRRLRSQDE